MTSDQVRPIDALQRLGDAMPVTSPRFTLEARQCHALAGSHPPSDFFESRALARETFTLILGKQCIVIGLSMRFVSLLRRNTQLRQMFIADPDAFTRMPQCAFGKAVLTTQRIAPHVAEQRCPVAQQFVEVAFDTPALVSDGHDSRWLTLRFGGSNACQCLRLKRQIIENFAPRRVIGVSAILLNDQCIAAKPRMATTEPSGFQWFDCNKEKCARPLKRRL